MEHAPKLARETIACHDCEALVSFSATSCPRCGSREPTGVYVMSARERPHFGSKWENDRTLIGMIVLCGGIGIFCGALIGDNGTAVGYGFVGAGIGASAGFIINLTRKLFGLVASVCKRQQADLGLLDGLPAEDRHQRMGGRTILCAHGCASLAGPAGASKRAGLDTPLPEPVSQSLHHERPLVGRFQECRITQRRASQDRVELWQDRDHLIERLRAAVLVLAKGDPAAGMAFSQRGGDMLRLSNVRPADPREVGDALPELQEQHQLPDPCDSSP
jgi:hypothetical protein